MTAREKTLEKIRKLLTLAEDPGAAEGEIENAMNAAQKLMSQHDIDLEDVELSPEDLTEDDEILFSPKQGEMKNWTWTLMDIIADSQNCQVVRNKKIIHDENGRILFDKKSNIVYEYKFRIFGTKMEVKLVKEIYLRTIPIIRKLANKRYQEKSKNDVDFQLEFGLPLKAPNKGKFFNDYIEGFLQGLRKKLSENKKQIIKDDESGKYGLILVRKSDLIKKQIETSIPRVKAVKTTRERDIDYETFIQGKRDGETEHEKRIE